jgi:hypothetical protein
MFRFLEPQKSLKKTRIKLYNTLALAVLLYGSETWTVKARDVRRITAAEMNFEMETSKNKYIRNIRILAGYCYTKYSYVSLQFY